MKDPVLNYFGCSWLSSVIVSGSLFLSVVARAGLATGAVAYYPFNQGATDQTGHGYDGGVFSADLAADRFGNSQSAYAFNGFSYISIAYAPAFDIETNGEFTISLWAQPAVDARSTSYALFVKGDFSSWDYGLYYTSGNRFMVGSMADERTQSIEPAVVGNWYHLVGTYSNRNWSLFINGSLVSRTINGGGVHKSLNGAAIGRKGISLADYFRGSIDEVRFYSRALTVNEVALLHEHEREGLYAYYPLNGSAEDVTANGHDGAVAGAILSSDRYGNTNAAYSFANSSYIGIPYSWGLDVPTNGQFSIALWAKPSASQSGSKALFVKGDFNSWNYGIYLSSGATYSFFNGSCNGEGVHSAAISPERWYHVVGTYSNQDWTLYVNGVSQGTHSAGPALYQSTQAAALGKKGTANSDYYQGWLDGVRFYHHALSAAEAQALYLEESSPTVYLVKAVTVRYANLIVGQSYQLQVSNDLSTWTDYGSPFIANSITATCTNYWKTDEWNELFFRLH